MHCLLDRQLIGLEAEHHHGRESSRDFGNAHIAGKSYFMEITKEKYYIVKNLPLCMFYICHMFYQSLSLVSFELFSTFSL